MLEYEVSSQRLSGHGSVATTNGAEMRLAAGMEGRGDAHNPAELSLAARSACMLKGIERVTPILESNFRDAALDSHGWRQDSPSKMIRITYTLWVDTDENDQ